MAVTVQQCLDDIRTEAGFDVDEPTALRWLDRRQKRMCARTRCYRKTLAVGDTVAGTAFYALAGVVELYSLELGGVPYTKARRPDVYGYSQGALVWVGTGGFILADADADAVNGVTLIPTPDSSGTAITAFAAVVPPDAEIGQDIVIDDDLADDLVAGAIATGFLRKEERPDLAEAYETRFDAACQELELRTKRRFRGPGPSQIRVVGYNA